MKKAIFDLLEGIFKNKQTIFPIKKSCEPQNLSSKLVLNLHHQLLRWMWPR